jgi:hypothetical protein
MSKALRPTEYYQFVRWIAMPQFLRIPQEQKATMQVYRDKMENLYSEISGLPKNRGTALALTKLEEAAMWLNKGITNNC